MPSNPDPRRADRLADVYARAERLRLRRARRVAGTAFGSIALLVTGVLVGANLDAGQLLRTVAPAGTTAPSTSTTASPTTTSIEANIDDDTTDTSALAPVEPDDGPDAGTDRAGGDGEGRERRTTTTAAPPPTTTSTTTAPPCRNSRDPACGPLRYEPVPVNQAMTIEVTVKPANPEPGEEVTFTVKVSDDGPVSPASCVNTQRFGEDDESVPFCTAACAAEAAKYGPWDPPPPEDISFEETFRHTYDKGGTFTATFAYNAGADCSFSPYRSQGEGTVDITVR